MLNESPEFRHFRKAFSEGKAPLTIFLGAGLSMPAGIPNWQGLLDKLKSDVKQKVNNFTDIEAQLRRGEVKALNEAKDFWVAFQLAKNLLTAATFESSVQECLSPPVDEEVPQGYFELLKLNPNTFASLNLDRFAGMASSESNQKFLTPLYGKEIAAKWNSYFHSQPSVIYLHGDIYSPSTWVLTKAEIDQLLDSPGHRRFIEHTYLNNIVLFVGLSADDAALSLPLLRLVEDGIAPPQVYWLTDRVGVELEQWANKHRVRIIRYTARSSKEHLDAIKTFVSESLKFTPSEPYIPPEPSSVPVAHEDVPPSELAKREPEEIRKYCASKLNQIIEDSEEKQIYENFRQFCTDYDFALYQGFYRPSRGSPVKWFNYELELPSIGRGNFGEVYSARNGDGDIVAVKIMNRTAFESDEMLGGFRRGVRSMRHVNEGGITGMTSLIEAFELPPTIIMPFVSGLSLQDILDSDYTISWLTKLRIISRVAEIVSDAHALPSTVMHRDLKPSNIMVKDFDYTQDFDPDIVVLDFDMSWHKGSKEKDVVFESRDDFGYLAPEQTTAQVKFSPRNTKVDSYGLGMTAFALFSGKPPLANEPLNPEWLDLLHRVFGRGFSHRWASAPARLARIIYWGTRVDQDKRRDFFRLKRQLQVLLVALEDSGQLEDVDVWAEELLARIGSSIKYVWNDDNRSGELRLPGVSIFVDTNPVESEISVKLEHIDEGMQKRGNMKQFLTEHSDKVARILSTGGWVVELRNVMMSSLIVQAKVKVSALHDEKAVFESLQHAVDDLRS